MKMELQEAIELIKILKQSWGSGAKIAKRHWEKLRGLFKKGDKSIGLVAHPEKFQIFQEISRRSFVKKYSPYIYPTKYRAYLLQSIAIKNFYEIGDKKKADKMRIDLAKQDSSAARICSLYSSGMLSVVWKRIDQMLEAGDDDATITGTATKILDDLISNKSIIYVKQDMSLEQVTKTAAAQFEKQNYCLIFGSESQVKKVEKVSELLEDHPSFSGEKTELIRWKEGEIRYSCLSVFRRVKLTT